jgi:hypothetical protein
MALTHFDLHAKPAAKPFKLADGGGLFLIVQPNGSKQWRLRYFYLGKERSLSIGAYPIVSLADARAMTANVRNCSLREAAEFLDCRMFGWTLAHQFCLAKRVIATYKKSRQSCKKPPFEMKGCGT